MRYTDISDYIDSLSNLEDIVVTFKSDEEESGNYYVVKTKETFVFEDEESADQKINEVRANPGFAGVDKKYKAGKMNKAGEVTKPETWTVVAKLNK